MPIPAITAYILAGGRSSRMGSDKAMLPLAGRTLLARAVEIARAVAPEVREVALLGDRHDLQGADRSLPDLHPGCGPVGGMETALRDLASRPDDSQKAEWACFLPVDMPFLPAGLYATLIRRWVTEGRPVAYPVVDDRLQPLISLLHVSVLPYLAAAVDIRRLRVTSVLNDAAKELGASLDQLQLHTDSFAPQQSPRSHPLPWSPSPQQFAIRHLWFSNLNTPGEFEEGESFLTSLPGDETLLDTRVTPHETN